MKKSFKRKGRKINENGAHTAELEIDDPSFLVRFFGIEQDHVAVMEDALEVCMSSRGNKIFVQGDAAGVDSAVKIIRKCEALVKAGNPVESLELGRVVATLIDEPTAPVEEMNRDIVFHAPGMRTIVPKSPSQKAYIDAMRRHDLTFAIGPAGTGKTYLAVAMAVAFLKQRKFQRVILTRPAVEAGEKLGYLPGDLIEKVNPYLRPLYDALNDMMDIDKSRTLIERSVIEVAPLAFMRGRTLNASFIILDEAQNTSIAQMKMFLTRLGFDSKAVIAGDITQVDLDPQVQSGLIDANVLLQKIPGIAFCYFTEKDVVRHPLVQHIIKRYETR